MFMDELNRLDRVLNSPVQRRWLRRSAYNQFRDRSERIESVGHSKPRKRVRRIIVSPDRPQDEAGE